MASKFDLKKFADAYNNTEKYPTLASLALAFKIHVRTVQDFVIKCRLEKIQLVDRSKLQQQGNLKAKQESQTKIVKDYLTILAKKHRRPLPKDLSEMGHDGSKINRNFGGLDALHKYVKKIEPKAFDNIVDETLFTREAFRGLQAEAKKYKRFVITTAVVGCKVDENMLKSIDLYCKENDALLLILMAADPAANVGWTLDPILKDRLVVFDDLSLNKSLFISTIKLSAKHIDPITGLKRIGQRNGSFIYASPKQRMKPVANSPTHHPVVLMTTGALTKPMYTTDRYMSERTAYIAKNDHVMGGLIVEVVDEKMFHYRQFQADKSGSIVDLGKMYTANEGVLEYNPEAIKTGDWHTWWTNQDAKRCWLEIAEELSIPNFLVDDLFDGTSINHHDRKNKVRQAQKAIIGKTSLEAEVKANAQEINDILNVPGVEKVVVVEANHNEFLYRYLCDGIFADDRENFRYCLDLAKVAIDGGNPLKFAIEECGVLEQPEKVHWMHRDEEFKVAHVECGQHGDMGSDGAYASVQSLENSYGNCVVGHTHSPEIFRGVWRVGTSSELRLPYTKGSSSWMHTSALIYPNGMRQLINVINGQWRLED